MARKDNAVHKNDIYPLADIQGVRVRLPHPEKIPPIDFVERKEIVERALAAWMPRNGMKPLNFRFFGPPGVGKNAIVYHLARLLKKPLYILNGNEELDPEDVACSARFASGDRIEYVASPLFAAMLAGGIFFFDEIGKAPPGALNPLASVLDERRTLDSVLAGIRIGAHDGFLFCAALNEDEESGGRLPLFLQERLSPAIRVGIPPAGTFRKILQKHLPQGDDRWVEIYMKEFRDPGTSPRDARSRLQFAYGMAGRSGASRATDGEIREFLKQTVGRRSGTEPTDLGGSDPTETRERAVTQEKSDEIERLLVLRKGKGGDISH
jgi:hypothetical protein